MQFGGNTKIIAMFFSAGFVRTASGDVFLLPKIAFLFHDIMPKLSRKFQPIVVSYDSYSARQIFISQ